MENEKLRISGPKLSNQGSNGKKTMETWNVNMGLHCGLQELIVSKNSGAHFRSATKYSSWLCVGQGFGLGVLALGLGLSQSYKGSKVKESVAIKGLGFWV